ncbi:flippase [Okeania sp. SIO2B3]|uniref:flippase n=1 Tax=Okeania sp. SIO2B3 TaxID=2607784 RepID=UPI0013C24574|nr:flippase [Okeania sp. SIO2B3]NET43254.1 flippase [Okeania sp. SIO2B3]
MKNLLKRLDWSYFYTLLGEGTLALTFFYYIILARVLGPERYEIFAAAVALGGVFSLLIQFGLPFLMQREVAANPEVAPKSTIKFLSLQGLNTLPILVVLLPLAMLLHFEGEGLIVCYLVIFAEVCRSTKMTLRAVLKGMGWFRSETISVAIERLAVVCCVLGVLLWTNNLVLVVATLVLVRFLEILGLLYYLHRKVNIWSSFNIGSLRELYRIAYPFAISGVLWVIYYQVDVLMLKAIASTGETGFYSAAYRILEIFSALPRVVFQVAFTRFAKYHANDPERLPEQVYKSTRVLLAVVLPVLIIAGFFQTSLVKVLYGDAYRYSVYPLAILLPSLSIKTFASMLNVFFQSTGREKKLPRLLFIAATANILINLILIPYIGSVGAALATLLSECILLALFVRLMINIGYNQIGKSMVILAGLSLVAASIPSLILVGVKPIIGTILLVICFGLIVLMMQKGRFILSS